ncbi:MAG TPA: hypothetical protein VOA64_20935 [Candidatus Dormibacteraeota bacterium]|nr:hypothetical protein [Candidatus Dormibacteraeota bacterium]
MRFRIPIILLVMALAASSAVSAPDNCTNSIIKGDYAFTIHGQILPPNGPPLLVDGIAKTTFDGDGNVTQLDTVAINGNITEIWHPGTGSYTVNPDCTGTMTLISTGQPTLHLAILVSQSGNHIHTVVTNPGFATTSDAERIWANGDQG